MERETSDRRCTQSPSLCTETRQTVYCSPYLCYSLHKAHNLIKVTIQNEDKYGQEGIELSMIAA